MCAVLDAFRAAPAEQSVRAGAPGPVKTSRRKAQQKTAEGSPPFCSGKSASGWWTLKYAYAMEPEQTRAATRVPRPSTTRLPPTSWMTAAYQPGQVPHGYGAAAHRATEDAEERGGAVAGEEQAHDDPEQGEGVGVSLIQA